MKHSKILEPYIRVKQRIGSDLKEAIDICKRDKIRIEFNFDSGGILLTKDITFEEILKNNSHDICFQPYVAPIKVIKLEDTYGHISAKISASRTLANYYNCKVIFDFNDRRYTVTSTGVVEESS